MEERLKEIMANIFMIDKESINLKSTQDDIDEWDSIGQLNLITAIEEEFNITFDIDHITEMISFELIVEITKEVLNKD